MKHNHSRLLSRFTVLFAFASSVSAFAVPIAPIPYLELEAKHFGTPDESAGAYHFDGIVALDNCSGSLVRFADSLATENAMVLTNGHCLADRLGKGMPKPGVVIMNRDVQRNLYVLDDKTGQRKGTIHATKILYATMTKTDMTLYQVAETYQQIEENFATHALTIAKRFPATGEGIDIISGYWKRGYTCRVEAIVHELREAAWTMNDSIRYSQPGCATIGGTSGSPIISMDTKEVVGVNNTGNEDGEKCTMNNPCEVDVNGTITFEKGRSYGQQVSWVYTCLTADRKIDLSIAGCLLAKPTATDDRDDPYPGGSKWPKAKRR